MLLAWRDRWRESVLSEPLERHTDQTTVDPDALRRDLHDVRSEGYAVEDAEYQPDVRAVAAPVLISGEALAALTVSGRQVDLEAVLAPTLQTARELANDLDSTLCPAKTQRD